MKKNWYCYVCGSKLWKRYFLCSLSGSVDRCFLICKNCIEEVDKDEETIIIEVMEVK